MCQFKVNTQRFKPTQRKGRLTGNEGVVTALTTLISFSLLQAATPKTQTPKKEAPRAHMSDWQAFGSGCRASLEKSNTARLESSTTRRGLLARFFPNDFALKLGQGLQGVRECALRISIEPLAGFKIKDVRAKAVLEASKSDGDRLRARILLLLGDAMLMRREWDLQPKDFAKRREYELILSPEPAAAEVLKATRCGQAQIVGLDVTFEGVRNKDDRTNKGADPISSFSLKPNNPAEVEVTLEPCDR